MPTTTRATHRAPALAAAAVAACAIAAIPLVYLVVRVVGADPGAVADLLGRPRLPLLIGNTVALAASVTVSAAVLGLAGGFVLGRAQIAARGAWAMAAVAPLAVPSYLAAYGWLSWFPGIHGFWGSWFVLTAVSAPYVTLPVAAALRAGTTGLDDVARTLGRGPFGAFVVGTWPQVRPAVLAGSLLVFLYTLSEFGVVALLRFPVLTTAIRQAYGASFSRDDAAVLATVLVALALVVVVAEQAARGRALRVAAGSAAGARQTVRIRPAWLVPAFAALAAPVVVGVIVPLAALGSHLLRAETLREFDPGALAAATANTILYAGAGALIALALALPIGVLAARRPGRLARAVEATGQLALGLPGIVVGLSLVSFSLTVVPAFYQTAAVLAFAYGVLFMPKAIGGIRSATAQVPHSLEDVARTLGLSRARTWRTVTLRLARPGIVAAALLVTVTAMKELPATLMLRPTGADTLAVALWSRTDVAAYGAAAPYAAALVLVAAVPALLLADRRREREGGLEVAS